MDPFVMHSTSYTMQYLVLGYSCDQSKNVIENGLAFTEL